MTKEVPNMPKKRLSKGTALSSLLGLVGLLSGVYAIFEIRGTKFFGFSIIENKYILAVILVICSLWLIKEVAQRSSYAFFKRKVDSF